MWQHELRQDCSQQHSWDQLGLGIAEGAKGGKGILYLSPRMAYWLSSCRCCIEAPPVSSLPRFLCFTTSKVFSISLSLKRSCTSVRQQRDPIGPVTAPVPLVGLHLLARFYVLGGGKQRWELCVAVDLGRRLVGHSFGGRGQPSPRGAVYPRSL